MREKLSRFVWLLRQRRLPQSIGFASQFVLGYSLYTNHLATYLASDQIPVRIEGNIMYLSPNDAGISTELFHFGTREKKPTEIMRRECARVKEVSEDPTILEIGSHRGYYTFQAADILDGSGTIYAIEPEPVNFEALAHGIEANGFTNVSADRCAIGDGEETGTLHISRKSNSHTLRSVSNDMRRKYTGETVQTDIHTVDNYLADRNVSPEEVDIVKIDVEGYENAVFTGMEPLLNADSDLLVFVELHPHRVKRKELHSIVDAIETAEFELVHASSSAESNLPDYGSVKRHLETSKGRHSVDLIARRHRRDVSSDARLAVSASR